MAFVGSFSASQMVLANSSVIGRAALSNFVSAFSGMSASIGLTSTPIMPASGKGVVNKVTQAFLL